MAKCVAIHTIHRPGKRKGEQEVIKPGTEFESTGTELEGLKARGAVKVLEDKAPAKSAGKATKSTAKAPEKDEGDGDGELGEL